MSLNVGGAPSLPQGTPSQPKESPSNIPQPQPPETPPTTKITGRIKLRNPPRLSYEQRQSLLRYFSEGNVEEARKLAMGRTLYSVMDDDFIDVKNLAKLAVQNPNRLALLKVLVDNLSQHPEYEKHKEGLLSYVVEQNCLEAVELLLNSGVAQTVAPDKKAPLDIALEHGLLTVGKLLNHGFIQLAAARLSRIQDPNQVKNQLFLAYLNSSFDDTLELVRLLKRDDVERLIREEGSLIARFPYHWDQMQMVTSYNSNPLSYEEKTYLQMQNDFASRRYQNYQKVLHEAQGLDFRQVYQRLMQPGAGDDKRQYLELRHRPVPDVIPRTRTEMKGRYTRFIPYVQLGQKAASIHGKSLTDGLLSNNFCMDTVYYQLETILRNGKTIPLTRVHIVDNDPRNIIWEHTQEPFLEDIENEQMLLFEEIKHETSFPELKWKVAYFYWLGIQAMYSKRGNSQSFLELHKLCYALHNIQVPPPSQTTVLPDCVALCLPFDVFYNDYYDKLWEKPITP